MGNTSGTLSAVQLQSQAQKHEEKDVLPLLRKSLKPSLQRRSTPPSIYMHRSLRTKKSLFHVLSARGFDCGLRELAESVRQQGMNDSAQVLANLVNRRTSSGMTCLMYACVGGHLETGKLLISLGADPVAVDKNGNTALHHAARSGHGQVVAWLLELASEFIDVLRNTVSNSVHGSSSGQGYNARRRVAPPSARQVEALLPILERISNSSSSVSAESSVNELADDGTEVPPDGLVPPPQVSTDSSLSPDQGDSTADAPACGISGSSVTSAQPQRGHHGSSNSTALPELLHHSPSHSSGNGQHAGFTPVVTTSQPQPVEPDLPAVPPFAVHLSSRSRLPCRYVDMQNNCGFTAMHLAAATGCIDVAQVLLAAGCNYSLASTMRGQGIMARWPRRSNPLHIAAARGHIELVRLILQAVMSTPADVRRPDPRLLRDVEGHQPYMVAGNAGNWGAAQLLISVSRDDTHAFWSSYPLLGGQRERVDIPKLGVMAAKALQEALVAQIGQLADEAVAAGTPSQRRQSNCSDLSRSSSLQAAQSLGAPATPTAAGRVESSRSLTRGGAPVTNDLATPGGKLGSLGGASDTGPALSGLSGMIASSSSRAGSLHGGDGSLQAALNAAGHTAPGHLATASFTSRHSSEEGGMTCELCYERPRMLKITSCTHSMCASCSKRVVLMGAGMAVAPRCAFCQRPIQGFCLRAQ